MLEIADQAEQPQFASLSTSTVDESCEGGWWAIEGTTDTPRYKQLADFIVGQIEPQVIRPQGRYVGPMPDVAPVASILAAPSRISQGPGARPTNTDRSLSTDRILDHPLPQRPHDMEHRPPSA